MDAKATFDSPRVEIYLTRNEDRDWRRSALQDSASGLPLVVINKRKRYVEPQERTALHPTVREELQSLVDVLPEVADFSVVFDGFDARRLGDFIDSDPVVTHWYHGTSSEAWKAIQQEGLLPRSQTGAEATYAGLSAPEGDPRYTYLAADPGNDVRFAAREAAKKHGGEPVILEISVDGVVLDDLEPDEDAGVDSWEESLAYMGTVRYGGPIPASAISLHLMNRGGGWTTGSPTTRQVYHVAQATDRASIQSRGLIPSRGWQQEGVYVSTNPTSWQFMYEPGGVYEAEAIDVWEVDAKGYELEPDDNETADPEEDYVILHEVPPSRLRLAYSLVWAGDDWVADSPRSTTGSSSAKKARAEMKYAYHVTPEGNLDAIWQHGLQPGRGMRLGDTPAVYVTLDPREVLHWAFDRATFFESPVAVLRFPIPNRAKLIGGEGWPKRVPPQKVEILVGAADHLYDDYPYPDEESEDREVLFRADVVEWLEERHADAIRTAMADEDNWRPFTGGPIPGIDVYQPGRYWFEYHCFESPESGDAEAWYRSHQQVDLLGLAEGGTNDPGNRFAGAGQRAEWCTPLVYRARFDDGLEWDLCEDEIMPGGPETFSRPDPPPPPGTTGSPEVSFLTVTQEMAEALNSVGFYHGTGYLEDEDDEEEDYYGDGGVEMTPLGGLYVTPRRDFASYYAESKRLYLSGARGTLDEGDEVIHRITILPGAEIALDEDPFGAYDAFKHYQHTQPFFGLYGAYGVVRDLMAEAGVLEDFEADLSRIGAEIEEEGNEWDFSPDDFEDDLARWTQDYAAPVLGEWLKQYRVAVKAGVPVPMPPELRILNDQFVADPPLPSDE